MPNMPNFSVPLLTVVGAAATVAFIAFPVLMLAFVIFLIRTRRRTGQVSRRPLWLLGTGSASLLLLVFGAFMRLPVVDGVALGLLVWSLVLCVLLLRSGQGRPLHKITWAIFADLLVLIAVVPVVIWAATLAAQISAASNPNEAEVRATLARDPNDAAAHSSLASIDEMRGDHAGEIAEFQQVLRIEPDNENALCLLGVRLSKEKRIEEARPLFQKLAAGDNAYSANARKWLVRHGGP